MWFLSSPSPEPLVTFIMAVAGIISTNKEPILKNVSRLIIAIGLVVSLIWSVDNPGFEPIIQAFTCALGIMATFTDSSNTIQRRGLPPKPIIRQPITTPRKIFTLILGVATWVFVWHVALNWGFDSSEIQGLLGFIVFDEIGNYYPNSALGIGLWNCFIGIVFIGPLVQDLKDDNNDLIL